MNTAAPTPFREPCSPLEVLPVPNYLSKRRVVVGTWPGQTPSIGRARAAGATRAARAHLGRCGVCCAHGAGE